MSRLDATYGIWFYLILLVSVAIAYVVKNIPKIQKLLPLVLVVIIFAAFLPDGKFVMSTREGTDYQICMNLNHYVIDSIMEAEREGVEEITITIPNHSDDLRSVTYNESLGQIVSNCLYAQGVIEREIKVITVLDSGLNEFF